MDEVVKKAIGLAEQKTKTASSVPWKTNEPWKQPWHLYDPGEKQWQAISNANPFTPTKPTKPSTPQPPETRITRLALYSWNIDFMLPYPDSRMRTAIRHLESLIGKDQEEREKDTATVIFLQECVASDLTLIAADPWIQSTFAITDLSTANWQSGHYGTTTLIDRRLAIRDVFRVHYEKTRMQRDGLFVDISFPSHTPSHTLPDDGDSENRSKIIRLCNTHLESLALSPPLRPAQMELIAQYMHGKDSNTSSSSVSGAAVAGDFNAIQPFDAHLHTDNGLSDAYLSTSHTQPGSSSSEEADEGGHTWGQQASTTQRERFGTSRMDKVFYCGEAMKCVAFERFGAGVEVEDESERERLIGLGFERPWITDHLGVKAVFKIA